MFQPLPTAEEIVALFRKHGIKPVQYCASGKKDGCAIVPLYVEAGESIFPTLQPSAYLHADATYGEVARRCLTCGFDGESRARAEDYVRRMKHDFDSTAYAIGRRTAEILGLPIQ